MTCVPLSDPRAEFGATSSPVPRSVLGLFPKEVASVIAMITSDTIQIRQVPKTSASALIIEGKRRQKTITHSENVTWRDCRCGLTDTTDRFYPESLLEPLRGG